METRHAQVAAGDVYLGTTWRVGQRRGSSSGHTTSRRIPRLATRASLCPIFGNQTGWRMLLGWCARGSYCARSAAGVRATAAVRRRPHPHHTTLEVVQCRRAGAATGEIFNYPASGQDRQECDPEIFARIARMSARHDTLPRFLTVYILPERYFFIEKHMKTVQLGTNYAFAKLSRFHHSIRPYHRTREHLLRQRA